MLGLKKMGGMCWHNHIHRYKRNHCQTVAGGEIVRLYVQLWIQGITVVNVDETEHSVERRFGPHVAEEHIAKQYRLGWPRLENHLDMRRFPHEQIDKQT